jgi:hypothetical protein
VSRSSRSGKLGATAQKNQGGKAHDTPHSSCWQPWRVLAARMPLCRRTQVSRTAHGSPIRDGSATGLRQWQPEAVPRRNPSARSERSGKTTSWSFPPASKSKCSIRRAQGDFADRWQAHPWPRSPRRSPTSSKWTIRSPCETSFSFLKELDTLGILLEEGARQPANGAAFPFVLIRP